MLLSNLEGKKIVFLGVDCLTVDLTRYFNANGIAFKIVENVEIRTNHFIDNSVLLKECFININDYNFDEADYIILTESFFDNIDKYEILKNKIILLKSRTFLQEEFVLQIFNEKKIIGVFGKSYKYFFYNFLSKLFKTICGKNVLSSLSAFSKNIDSDNSDTILIFLDSKKTEYIKTMQFDKLLLLSFENYDREKIDNSTKNHVLNKQKINSEVLFNLDNANVKNFYDDEAKDNKLNIENKVIFSTTKLLDKGYSLINSTIYDYHNQNNLSYNIQKNESMIGHIKETSLLASFIILNEFFQNDRNIIFENIATIGDLENNLEYLEQVGNIHFISNLVNVDESLYLEPTSIKAKNYYISVVGKESNFLPTIRRSLEENNVKLFLIDIFEVLNTENVEKLNCLKYNNVEECFENVKQQLLKENNEENITVVLTTTDNVKLVEVNNKYARYVNGFKKLLEEIKNA